MLSTEELLKPRYKVIADYPHNVVPVGEILFIRPHQENVDVNLWMSKYDEFPHLFKKLEWWEERGEKNMPEYVKHKIDLEVYKLKNQAENTPSDAYCIKRSSIGTESYYQWVSLYDLLPATYEEYEQYLSQQTNK
jgi:hypothetical protein